MASPIQRRQNCRLVGRQRLEMPQHMFDQDIATDARSDAESMEVGISHQGSGAELLQVDTAGCARLCRMEL